MSEEKEQKKRVITELKHPLPDVRVSLDSQFDIVAAYAVASNNGKNSVAYKELAPYLKIDPQMVSGCNKFFQHLGLITPSEKGGKYTPTKLALDLYNARKWKNDELIKSTLRKILENSWFWIQTKQYLEVNDSASQDELIQKLGLGCGADPQKHKRALNKLIEYIQSAGLVKQNEGKFELNTEIPIDVENKTIEQTQKEKHTVQNNSNTIKDNITTFHAGPVNISLGLLIDPETSEEQIRKTVRIVVDELKKISQEEEAQ